VHSPAQRNRGPSDEIKLQSQLPRIRVKCLNALSSHACRGRGVRAPWTKVVFPRRVVFLALRKLRHDLGIHELVVERSPEKRLAVAHNICNMIQDLFQRLEGPTVAPREGYQNASALFRPLSGFLGMKAAVVMDLKLSSTTDPSGVAFVQRFDLQRSSTRY